MALKKNLDGVKLGLLVLIFVFMAAYVIILLPSKTLLKKEETKSILEEFKQHIISKGLGDPQILYNEFVLDPEYKDKKSQKQWVWSYKKKFNRYTGILSCEIMLLRYADPSEEKITNYRWVVFPKTLYHEGPNVGIEETVDKRFYLHRVVTAKDLEDFLKMTEPPGIPRLIPQILMEIIWHAMQGYFK
ncbi:hypothetical protein KY348_06655 [Candidatus Woesearchaeota archaeon]|nr:hypothetical protein [Candidatus Woesearchaeota archaeon]